MIIILHFLHTTEWKYFIYKECLNLIELFHKLPFLQSTYAVVSNCTFKMRLSQTLYIALFYLETHDDCTAIKVSSLNDLIRFDNQTTFKVMLLKHSFHLLTT